MRRNFKPEANHYFSQRPTSKPRFGLIRTHLRGGFFEFLTASGVFSKTRIDLGTRLLIESMVFPENGCMLDLGCGYGAVGIVAARLNPHTHVVMVDVNERAIRLAKKNAKINGVANVEFKHGFLYEPVSNMRFEAILTNPPVSAGMKIIHPMIEQAPQHMTKNGTFQMVVRSKIGRKTLMQRMINTFGNAEVLARQSGYRVLISKT
ncbi:MAG: class I SAM-dependent methyltransferase [Candidatus Bathyarchaeia archaeon]|nr:class I SAM-dependent methyltransferase [Candidatus Bathyarchaeota archaeon A05DMB-4]MDH7595631.1 class I SAM-dependent methyltransferase [Candidatus Bathyarchaeota archaeon]